MSQFSYADYEDVVAQAQAGASNNTAKVGYFKLSKPNDSALVRFNIGSMNDLPMASIHAPIFGTRGYVGLSLPFTGVSCLNKVGDYSDTCPFCKAAAENHAVIGKASKKCYVPMLVAYRNTDGSFGEPQPVIWERPSGFGSELKAKLANNGDLRNSLYIITRIGSGTQTRYSIDYAMPTVFKDSLVPADFSAFENFKIDKHSFWVKTADEMNAFINTGAFPEVPKAEQPQTQAKIAQPAAQPQFIQPQGIPQAPQGQPQFAGQPQTPTFEQAEANPFPSQPQVAPAQPAAQVVAEQPAATQQAETAGVAKPRTWF